MENSIKAGFERLVSLLEPYYGRGEAESICRIVFEDAFRISETKSELPFPPSHSDLFQSIASRLLKREPVQYILGQADFYGLKFEVNPHVLIPRQETEELVHWVLEEYKGVDLTGKRLLDVGSGSGCIPVFLKKRMPALEVVSVDVSGQALEVARRNAAKHQMQVDFRQLDFLDPENWPGLGSFDILISNPPYIDPSEKDLIPAHVMDYEPPSALFTTADPMEFYRAIARFSKKYLHKKGKIFLESNEFRLQEVLEELRNQGFDRVEWRSDLNGNPRMIRALC